MTTRRSAFVAVALLVAAGWAASPSATAADTVVVAGPGSAQVRRYATPANPVERGTTPTLVNTDVDWHDLVAEDVGPDERSWCTPIDPTRPESPANPRRRPLGQCPLFFAEAALPAGGTSAVLGMDGVVAGRVYAFRCTLVSGMTGTFFVLPDRQGAT